MTSGNYLVSWRNVLDMDTPKYEYEDLRLRMQKNIENIVDKGNGTIYNLTRIYSSMVQIFLE